MDGADEEVANSDSVRGVAERVATYAGVGALLGVVTAVALWLAAELAGGLPGRLALVDLVPLFGAGSSVLAAFVALALPIPSQPRPTRTLDERMDDLAGSLRQASAAVVDIEHEISARRRIAAELAEEAASHREILAARREEVEAITRLLRAELQQSDRRARRDQVILGFVFFFLGSVVSVLATLAFT